MSAVRNDDRFRDLTPESIVTVVSFPIVDAQGEETVPTRAQLESEGEIWVDWSFVEFWKTNICEYHTCVGVPC